MHAHVGVVPKATGMYEYRCTLHNNPLMPECISLREQEEKEEEEEEEGGREGRREGGREGEKGNDG